MQVSIIEMEEEQPVTKGSKYLKRVAKARMAVSQFPGINLPDPLLNRHGLSLLADPAKKKVHERIPARCSRNGRN